MKNNIPWANHTNKTEDSLAVNCTALKGIFFASSKGYIILNLHVYRHAHIGLRQRICSYWSLKCRYSNVCTWAGICFASLQTWWKFKNQVTFYTAYDTFDNLLKRRFFKCHVAIILAHYEYVHWSVEICCVCSKTRSIQNQWSNIPNKYRPISLISIFSEIFECLLYNRLMIFSSQFNSDCIIGSEKDCGTKKGGNCTHNLALHKILFVIHAGKLMDNNYRCFHSVFIAWGSSQLMIYCLSKPICHWVSWNSTTFTGQFITDGAGKFNTR